VLEIADYRPEHLPGAAALFIADLQELREQLPALPATLTDVAAAEALIGGFLTTERALVALDGGRVVGYLGWWLVERFRDAPRRAAYSPEYGHAAAASGDMRVVQALYSAAAARWAAAHCQIHALTALAGRPAVGRFWMESGFGMLGRDSLRAMTPIVAPSLRGMSVRRAMLDDAADLARLDIEHCRHYSAAPVLMYGPEPESERGFADFLAQEPNTAWVAEGDGVPQGFIRFEPVSHGAVQVSLGPTTVSITGAFVRPAWRGCGAAAAMLAGAVAHYAERGFQRMAVDYETTNPEARTFWPRYFEPVAISYVRLIERG
jgi:ribosomal protein S18 acetylase RimI-like enzyme